MLITIGVLIACMLGNVFSWRLLAVLYAVPSFILAVMMKFMPESPSHIIFNEEVSEKTIAKARKSLSRLRSYDSTIDSELEQIIQAKAQTPNESFNFFKRLRHSDFLKPFIYSIFLMFLQQLSGMHFFKCFIFSF